ncbi:DUF3000 domain-containing protein [Leucobacter sp. NPDC058333]|uniref:DUF3000 domain-containing protein n=1 Tax=Leucobacter sp. NPDC058333 TaxID=3346450 RepID=UPI003658DC80
MASVSGAPVDFDTAAEQIRGARLRGELVSQEIAAPERIAPQSIALAAGVARGVRRDDAADTALESPYGAGRIVLMHDPDAFDEWGGTYRIVCFAQAPLELEIGVDPFISDVAWSWLVDALDSRGAGYTYLSGTATKTLSTSFGALEARGDSAQIELRASWTPRGDDFAPHAEAWSELLCLLAGLPHAEGIDSIAARRSRLAAEGA